ncbi:unnamed protein product [Brassica oleracea]
MERERDSKHILDKFYIFFCMYTSVLLEISRSLQK